MWYDNAKRRLFTDDLIEGLSALLVSDLYVFDRGDRTVAHVEEHEIGGGGYVRQALEGVQVMIEESTHRAYVQADPVEWQGVTGVVGGIVLYQAGSEELVAFIEQESVLDDDTARWAPDSGVLEVK